MPITDWIGRTESRTDTVTAAPIAALSATLDRDDVPPRPGDPVPLTWHWLYFLPLHKQSELGVDGHARLGAFLPPVPLPRRMYAGGRVEARHPLRVGDAIERVSRIVDVAQKAGRSGPLVFVKVRHEISNREGLALVEDHDIVYRDQEAGPNRRRAFGALASLAEARGQADRAEADGPALQPSGPGAEGSGRPGPFGPGTEGSGRPGPFGPGTLSPLWQREVTPDEVLLFRYSALTFNGHRIHYDRRFATEENGYPGLVVHAPLVATLLADLLRRNLPEAVVSDFTFRALRPLFDGAPLPLCGRPSNDGRSVALWARDPSGVTAFEASAILVPGP